MLGPVERLKFHAASRKTSDFANALVLAVVLMILSLMYYFPDVATMIIVSACIAFVGVSVISLLLFVANEVSWIISGKRF